MTTYDTILMYCVYFLAMMVFTLITVVSDAEGNVTVLRLCRLITVRYKLRTISFVIAIFLWPLPATVLLIRSGYAVLMKRFQATRSTM